MSEHVGGGYQNIPAITPIITHRSCEFLLPSSQLFSAKTPPRHPFCWRPRYPRWCHSSYPRPSSCPCPSSLGQSEGDAPRSRRWPDSKALFSKMIKGGKWNRNLKCTRTWRASFFCIAWVAHQAEAFSSVSDQTILEQIQDLVLESSEKHLTGFYPLVNIQKTMENHHF